MANKKTLTVAVATELGISQAKAKPIVETIMNTIKSALESGDSVKIVNFAKFSVVQRKARVGVNPQTREKMNIPAKKAIKFKSGKALSDVVNVITDDEIIAEMEAEAEEDFTDAIAETEEVED